MLVRSIGTRALRRFSEQYAYDVGYMEEILDQAPPLFLGLGRISSVARRRRYTTVSAFYAAKIVGALWEDCGPCTQLVVDMARESGMADDEIRRVVSGEFQSLPPDARVGAELALAICRASDELPQAREAAEARWGLAGVAELSMTVALARFYPVLKRGMGHAQQCQQIRLGEERTPVGGFGLEGARTLQAAR